MKRKGFRVVTDGKRFAIQPRGFLWGWDRPFSTRYSTADEAQDAIERCLIDPEWAPVEPK